MSEHSGTGAPPPLRAAGGVWATPVSLSSYPQPPGQAGPAALAHLPATGVPLHQQPQHPSAQARHEPATASSPSRGQELPSLCLNAMGDDDRPYIQTSAAATTPGQGGGGARGKKRKSDGLSPKHAPPGHVVQMQRQQISWQQRQHDAGAHHQERPGGASPCPQPAAAAVTVTATAGSGSAPPAGMMSEQEQTSVPWNHTSASAHAPPAADAGAASRSLVVPTPPQHPGDPAAASAPPNPSAVAQQPAPAPAPAAGQPRPPAPAEQAGAQGEAEPALTREAIGDWQPHFWIDRLECDTVHTCLCFVPYLRPSVARLFQENRFQFTVLVRIRVYFKQVDQTQIKELRAAGAFDASTGFFSKTFKLPQRGDWPVEQPSKRASHAIRPKTKANKRLRADWEKANPADPDSKQNPQAISISLEKDGVQLCERLVNIEIDECQTKLGHCRITKRLQLNPDGRLLCEKHRLKEITNERETPANTQRCSSDSGASASPGGVAVPAVSPMATSAPATPAPPSAAARRAALEAVNHEMRTLGHVAHARSPAGPALSPGQLYAAGPPGMAGVAVRPVQLQLMQHPHGPAGAPHRSPDGQQFMPVRLAPGQVAHRQPLIAYYGAGAYPPPYSFHGVGQPGPGYQHIRGPVPVGPGMMVPMRQLAPGQGHPTMHGPPHPHPLQPMQSPQGPGPGQGSAAPAAAGGGTPHVPIPYPNAPGPAAAAAPRPDADLGVEAAKALLALGAQNKRARLQ